MCPISGVGDHSEICSFSTFYILLLTRCAALAEVFFSTSHGSAKQSPSWLGLSCCIHFLKGRLLFYGLTLCNTVGTATLQTTVQPA